MLHGSARWFDFHLHLFIVQTACSELWMPVCWASDGFPWFLEAKIPWIVLKVLHPWLPPRLLTCESISPLLLNPATLPPICSPRMPSRLLPQGLWPGQLSETLFPRYLHNSLRPLMRVCPHNHHLPWPPHTPFLIPLTFTTHYIL